MVHFIMDAASCGHAGEQMHLATAQLSQQLVKAETADSTPLQDGLTIPEEIKRRRTCGSAPIHSHRRLWGDAQLSSRAIRFLPFQGGFELVGEGR